MAGHLPQPKKYNNPQIQDESSKIATKRTPTWTPSSGGGKIAVTGGNQKGGRKSHVTFTEGLPALGC